MYIVNYSTNSSQTLGNIYYLTDFQLFILSDHFLLSP